MVLSVPPRLALALTTHATQQGVAPEVLALDILRQHLPQNQIVPSDEWERGLLAVARDCGVSLPDSALTSEALYE
jgi:hypothetical protein